jgi:NAD(P)-dependent dehydrogenase (short-subunit alcohol dehydrogenase family)
MAHFRRAVEDRLPGWYQAVLTLAEVSSVELVEVHLVNAIAPFVLNARLLPLMLRTPEPDKHIVNVSAVEGQFYR